MLAKYHDTMAARNPFDGLWRTHESIFNDDLIGSLFPSISRLEKHSCRVEQNENELIAQFDLPGVKPGDVDISAIDQKLTIEYTQRGKKLTQSYAVHRDYDSTLTSAKIEHGVLELRIPKIEKAKSKKIVIEVK